ncbi:type II toxin-antitoxin system RelE/ParE family toxin [Lonepinella sp. BR2474]|uniref:type II toxin-antitoxin system RelE/ParE family toxin n=1 Tax=Lonepinella sp. BR2474 TaxID=3434548 RepID=UPI003F6E229B
MYTIEKTETFEKWFRNIKDVMARSLVALRIRRAEDGNFGDCKSLGGGLYEMRIDTGKGYRVYYAQQGKVVYILLNGGDKSKQQADIEKAKMIWADIKKDQLIV